MSLHTARSPSLPHSTGGKTAIVLFILTLIAFVVESQLTQVRVSFYSSVSCISPSLHPLKKSMHKARFIIASRSSSSIVRLFKITLPSVIETPLSCLFSRSYIVHSSFAIIFPLYLLYLVLTTSASLESLLAGLSLAVKIHFAPIDKSRLAILQSTFPYGRLLRLTTFLTAGLTLPSVLWFISVSLSP
jgi:hypothetical protein